MKDPCILRTQKRHAAAPKNVKCDDSLTNIISETDWLVCTTADVTEVLKYAYQIARDKNFKYRMPIPIAQIAIRLDPGDKRSTAQLSSKHSKALSGTLFCCLELPIDCGELGFHINALFEVHENRREIWSQDDLQGD